jgi:hypothetical protein
MTYQFGEYYKANTITELVVEYTKTNGKFKYTSLGAVPVSEQWASITRSFTVPD